MLKCVCVCVIFITLPTHFTCTCRDTHTQAHMHNQHTRGIATTRHRSLVERQKKVLKTLYTKKKNVRKKTDIYESKKKN